MTDRRRHRLHGLYWRLRYLILPATEWDILDDAHYRVAIRESRQTP